MEQLPKERREFPDKKTINYLCVLCVSAVNEGVYRCCLDSLKVAPQVFRAMVATAVLAVQVTRDERIACAFRLVMNAVGALDVFDVIAETPHEAAVKAGLQSVAQFREQSLDDLHGDLTDVVADLDAMRAKDLDVNHPLDVMQQLRNGLSDSGIRLRPAQAYGPVFQFFAHVFILARWAQIATFVGVLFPDFTD
jgi:hypothetical protein